jgi:hypothetical protein
MPGLTIETPAAQDPVLLADAKNFLRIDSFMTDDDTLISALISAATATCENWTRRSFIQKKFKQTLDAFPYFTDTIVSQLSYPPAYSAYPRYSTSLWNYSQMIKLFRPPLISVDRVTYMDSGKQSFVDLVPQPQPWYPQTNYAFGAQVMDNNGPNAHVRTCIVNSNPSIQVSSGTDVPPWTKDGSNTVETTGMTWRDDGALPRGEFGAYIADTVNEPGRLFPGLTTGGQGNPGTGFWPSAMYIPNAVQIHFTAGYGLNPSDVPQAIRTAIMLTVEDAYENREPVKGEGETLPGHIKQLLWPYRILDLAPTRG